MYKLHIILFGTCMLAMASCPTITTTNGKNETGEGSIPIKSEKKPRTLLVECSSIFEEDYTGNSRLWDESDTPYLYEKVLDGNYTIHHISNTGITYSTVSAPRTDGELVILCEAEKIDGKSGHAYGLLFGMKDTDNCHMLVVSDTGHFTFGSTRGGAFRPARDWTFSSALKPGNAKNTIAIKSRRDSHEIFFNGRYVCDVRSGRQFGDRIGFIVYPTICLKVERIAVYAYALKSMEDGIKAEGMAYELGDFDVIDWGAVPRLARLFDYHGLSLRIASQGSALLEKDDKRLAHALFERGIAFAKRIDPPDLDILSFMLSKTGMLAYELGDKSAALLSLDYAMSLADGGGSFPHRAQVALLAGDISLENEDTALALSYYSRALDYAETDNDAQAAAACYRALSGAYEKTSDYAKAVSSYENAFRAESGRNDPRQMTTDALAIARLCEKGGAEQEAYTYYAKSAGLAKETGDKAGIKDGSFGAGRLSLAFESYTEAIDMFGQAYDSALSLKDTSTALECLSKNALALNESGEYASAVIYYEQAIAFAKKAGNPDLLFGLRNEASLAYSNAGKHDRALEILGELERSVRKSKIIQLIAAVTRNKGLVYRQMGEYSPAFSALTESAGAYESADKMAQAAEAHAELASAYSETGNHDKAMTHSGKSKKALEETKDGSFESSMYLREALLRSEWLEYESAIDLANKGIEASKAFRNVAVSQSGNDGIEAMLFLCIAEAYDGLGMESKAEEYSEKAAEKARSAGKRALLAKILITRGRLLARHGKQKEPQALFIEARDVCDKSGARITGLESRKMLASILVLAGDLVEGKKTLMEALSTAKRLKNEVEAALITGAIGDIEYMLGNNAKSLTDYSEAISIAEKFALVASRRERKRCADLLPFLYRAKQDAYLRAGKSASAFEAMLKASDWEFYSVAGAPTVALNAALSLDSLSRSIPKDCAAIWHASFGKAGIAALVVTSEGIKTVSGIHDPFLSEQNGFARSMAEAMLDKQALHKEEPFGQKEPLLFIRKPEQGKRELQEIESVYMRFLSDPQRSPRKYASLETISSGLYVTLFENIEKLVSGKSRLVFIQDYSLGFVPYETLRDHTGRFLIERFVISYASSLADMLPGASRNRPGNKPLLWIWGAKKTAFKPDIYYRLAFKRANDALAPFGEPVNLAWLYASAGIPETGHDYFKPHSSLLDSFPKAEIIPGPDSSEERLLEPGRSGRLSDYGILFFGGAGRVFEGAPSLSFVSIGKNSKEGNLHDGFLKPEEVFGLKACAGLVVLPYLDTGERMSSARGEETIFGRSFIRGGAKSVILPIWSQDERNADAFLGDFFKIAAGRTSEAPGCFPEALALAKRELSKTNPKDPFAWAGYICFSGF